MPDLERTPERVAQAWCDDLVSGYRLDTAWRMHRGWSIEGVTAQTRSILLLARYSEAVPGAYVPDLSASRLSVVHTALGAHREPV